MSNIATALKEEITRLIRKQLRGEMEGLKRASSRYRSDIAALKRRIDTLEKQIGSLGRAAQKQGAPTADREPAATKLRFKPQSMLAQRTRLGLSAREMGLLIGVSGQTIYHWEAGKTRPRPEQLANIAAVRKMGKRAVKAQLDQVQPDQKQSG